MPITAREVCSRFVRERFSKYNSIPIVKIVAIQLIQCPMHLAKL